MEINHHPATAQRGSPIFYRARTDRILLDALSPREFRRATEAAVGMNVLRLL